MQPSLKNVVGFDCSCTYSVGFLMNLAKGEIEYFRTRIGKFYRYLPVCNSPRLPHQLIHPLFPDHPITIRIHVDPMRSPRRMPIDSHTKANRSPPSRRPEDKIDVPGMKPKDDPIAGGIRHRCF